MSSNYASGKDIAVRVRGLSKCYTIAHNAQRHTTAGEALMHRLKHPFARPDTETFWALQDVAFDIHKGDVVGIIGRNGAGKSTLLKILSRIVEPTTGQIDLYGRVGSLLEVGTGFHPELTGRENVFLNGAILGMSKREIARQFDAIVDFSGTEQFLDTPVKRYSSGMYVRLAFAVAAHLNPEILIVDEVLAVGDVEFQKKCLGKMQDVADSGRTILFVSHNMTAVQSLCNRAIWLGKGRVLKDAPTAEVASEYLNVAVVAQTERVWEDLNTAPGNDLFRIRRASVRPLHGRPNDLISVRTPLLLEFEYWNLTPNAQLNISLHLYNYEGIRILNTGPLLEPHWHGKPFPVGLFRSTCVVPQDMLNAGQHRVQLVAAHDQTTSVYSDENALAFDVADSDELRGTYFGVWPGAVRVNLPWTTELVEEEDSSEKPETALYSVASAGA